MLNINFTIPDEKVQRIMAALKCTEDEIKPYIIAQLKNAVDDAEEQKRINAARNSGYKFEL